MNLELAETDEDATWIAVHALFNEEVEVDEDAIWRAVHALFKEEEIQVRSMCSRLASSPVVYQPSCSETVKVSSCRARQQPPLERSAA
jgi:hypothetical protein